MIASALGARAHRAALPVAVLLAVGMPLVALALRGVQPAGDTARYMEGARVLLAGDGVPQDALPYTGYVAVVAAVRALGLSTTAIALLQISCAAAAVLAVHRTANALAGPRAAALSALGLALNVDIWTWHLYVLTDSLYVTAVAVTTWLLHRAIEQRSKPAWVAAVAAAVAMVSLRPNGWLLLAAFGSYTTWRLLQRRRLLAAVLVLMAAGAVALQSPALQADDNVQAERMLREGVVNWGDRSSAHTMPGDVGGVRDATTALAYTADQPVAVLRLAGARVATEMAHVRPYYSTLHNAGIVLFLVPLYSLALVGAWGHRRQPLLWLLVLTAGTHMLIIAATFADYDGRFLLYSVPALTVLAGCGADQVLGHLAGGRAAQRR